MRALIGWMIRGYQWGISPLLHVVAGGGAGCRYTPSCSEYFRQAVETHGAYQGVNLGVRRLCRCHPWAGTSGEDPVPAVLADSKSNYG